MEANHLYLYTDYCANLPEQQKTRESLEENPSFIEFVPVRRITVRFADEMIGGRSDQDRSRCESKYVTSKHFNEAYAEIMPLSANFEGTT